MVPTDQLQIQHDQGVENRNQPERHESGDRQAADLCIAKRLPKRATVCSQRKQRNHCGGDRDHDGPQTQDARIDQRQFQVLARFSSLLDKFKQHDDVAYDHADETDDSKERHEAEWLAHDGERKDGPGNAVRNGRKYDQWLERMFELGEQGQIDGEHANHQDRCKVTKAADLLFLLACEAENKPVGELLLELFQLGHGCRDDFRR